MPRQVSIATMIEQLDGLRDTRDLTEWEQGFMTNIVERFHLARKDTRTFTERQIEKIESIYHKHFA